LIVERSGDDPVSGFLLARFLIWLRRPQD